MIPYLVGLVLISYLGAYGGKGIIPFGWDFLVIALFSTLILFLAVKSRVSYSEQLLDQRLEAISTC